MGPRGEGNALPGKGSLTVLLAYTPTWTIAEQDNQKIEVNECYLRATIKPHDKAGEEPKQKLWVLGDTLRFAT